MAGMYGLRTKALICDWLGQKSDVEFHYFRKGPIGDPIFSLMPPLTRSGSRKKLQELALKENLGSSEPTKANMGRPKGAKNHPKPSGWVPPPKRNNAAAQLLARCMNGNQVPPQEVTSAVVEDNIDKQAPQQQPVQANEERSRNKGETSSKSKDWEEQLVNLGYTQLKCQVPNKAVQALLCCFGETNIHEYILHKELTLTDSKLSAVAHLGFNGWLAVLARYMQNPEGVLTDILGQYGVMHEYICARTEKEGFTCAMGEGVIEYMESTNHVSSKNKKHKRNHIPAVPTKKPGLGNSIFGAARAGIANDNNKGKKAATSSGNINAKNAERLNMFNSYCFPALPNDLVSSC